MTRRPPYRRAPTFELRLAIVAAAMRTATNGVTRADVRALCCLNENQAQQFLWTAQLRGAIAAVKRPGSPHFRYTLPDMAGQVTAALAASTGKEITLLSTERRARALTPEEETWVDEWVGAGVQRIVDARSAPRLRKQGPASVFEFAQEFP